MKVTIDQFIAALQELKDKTSGDAEVTFWSDNSSRMSFNKDGFTVGYVLTPDSLENLEGNISDNRKCVGFEINADRTTTV